MRFHQAPNKRLIARAGNGRFRTTTARDVGLGQCEKCGMPFVPDFSGLGSMPDPRKMRRRTSTCGKCRKETA